MYSDNSIVTFEGMPNFLPCDGLACNPKKPCSEFGRWLCQDIIESGPFVGQFYITMPGIPRKVDFAFEATEGKGIVAELDGNEQDVIFGGSEVRADWTVLRLSLSQLEEKVDLCQKILCSSTPKVRCLDPRFDWEPLREKGDIYLKFFKKLITQASASKRLDIPGRSGQL